MGYSAAKERKWERAARFSAQASAFRLDFRPHGAPSRSARRIGGSSRAGVSASWERLGAPPPRSASRPPNGRHRALSSVFLTQARKHWPRLCCSAVTPSPQEARTVPKSPNPTRPPPMCVCARPQPSSDPPVRSISGSISTSPSISSSYRAHLLPPGHFFKNERFFPSHILIGTHFRTFSKLMLATTHYRSSLFPPYRQPPFLSHRKFIVQCPIRVSFPLFSTILSGFSILPHAFSGSVLKNAFCVGWRLSCDLKGIRFHRTIGMKDQVHTWPPQDNVNVSERHVTSHFISL